MNPCFVPLAAGQLEPNAAALYESIVESRKGVADVIGLIRLDGSLRGPFDPLMRTPEIGDVVQNLGLVVRAGSSLPAAVCEVAILTTVELLECDFEIEAHARLALVRNILRTEDVQAIMSGRSSDLAESNLALAWKASREQVQFGSMIDDTRDAAVEAFGERGVVELTVLVAYYQLVAALMNTCAPSPAAA